MQTFPVVIRLVEFDLFRRRGGGEVIDVNMGQTMHLRLERAEHRVVRVAGVTRLSGGYPMILEVSGGEIRRIVHMEALSVRLHYVARQAELRAF